MKMLLLAVLTAFVLPAAALAQEAAPVLPQWTIVPDQSSLTFEATQQGAPFTGTFGDISGAIAFDPAKPEAGNGTVRIGMDSASTQSPDRDRYIKDDSWFAVGKYPASTYTIESFQKNADNQYVAKGRLTIRDVSMPLNLPFTLKIDPPGTAHVEGETKLNRLDFGIGQGEWKDTSMIGNAVTVKVKVTATRAD